MEWSDRIINEPTEGAYEMYSQEYMDRLCKKAIEKYSIDNQFLKTQEELSELIRAISRFLISKNIMGSPDSICVENLIEEIVDVKIMLMQLCSVLPSEEIDRVFYARIDGLERKVFK